MAVSAPIVVPMRLLIQVDDREPIEIASGSYEVRVEGANVILSPDAVKEAATGMLREALDKAER